MRISTFHSAPFHHLHYRAAAPRGGSETRVLQFLRAEVDRLPDNVDAVLVTSDLQGVAPSARQGGACALLGEVLVEHYVNLADAEAVPWPERTGVVLAGDLYSSHAANKRGASGDVRAVWEAFADTFCWVAGVAGNHDRFGSRTQRSRLEQRANVHLLDGTSVNLDGLRLGGVGGIIAPAHKLHRGGRRTEDDFLRALRSACTEAEVLVLHEGPPGAVREQRGHPAIAEALGSPSLVVCGHVHWDAPLSEHADHQVLNVDGRVVLLEARA